MKLTFLGLVLSLSLSGGLVAQNAAPDTPAGSAVTADGVFQKLAGMSGKWFGWTMTEGGPDVYQDWTSTAGGTVVVETDSGPAMHGEEAKMFFSRSGEDLVVERFSSLGHDRAVLDRTVSTPERWVFRPDPVSSRLSGHLSLGADGKMYGEWVTGTKPRPSRLRFFIRRRAK